MHELALMTSIVAAVEEKTRPAQVACVRLQVGKLAGAIPEALLFCFEACTRGTTLEGAKLEIQELEGRARCGSCGTDVVLSTFLDLCPCGSADLEVWAGRELRIQEVEVQ
jgi:hydrogenase nickel incorporation protein HypA/HybF